MAAKKKNERASDPDWKKRVGTSIRKLREAQPGRISQASLASAIGQVVETVGDLERGDTVPSLATVEAIADELNVSIDSLIGRKTPDVFIAQTGSGKSSILVELKHLADRRNETMHGTKSGANRDRYALILSLIAENVADIAFLAEILAGVTPEYRDRLREIAEK